jgi:hypothetical protein
VRIVVGCLITDIADSALSNPKTGAAGALVGVSPEVGIRDLLSLSGVTGVDLIVAAPLPKKGEECGASGGRIFSMWIKGHCLSLVVGSVNLIVSVNQIIDSDSQKLIDLNSLEVGACLQLFLSLISHVCDEAPVCAIEGRRIAEDKIRSVRRKGESNLFGHESLLDVSIIPQLQSSYTPLVFC